MTPPSVLKTRLVAPVLPPTFVARPRLARVIAEALHTRLVGVVAGAGYGKTTALVEALHAHSVPFVWCSVDARMGDGAVLVAHIVAAFAAHTPGFGAALDATRPLDVQVDALANEVLDTSPDDMILVIDDVHLLVEDARTALVALLEALPASVHFLLASRGPLPIPMTRLRARGCVELGPADLAFTVAEAEAVLRSLGADDHPAHAAELHLRTEGWPAGVVLAARRGLDATTPVAEQHFAYLADQVVADLRDEVREFLLDTAVLGRFSAELAAWVSGRDRGDALIAELVDSNLFIVRLEGDGGWYRYHHLLQAFLLDRLRRLSVERWRDRHRRAAQWWNRSGQPTEAVPHLLEAGDLDAAIDTLEPVAETLALSAQANLLAGWLDQLPRERWARRPRLVLAHAALQLSQARHEASFAEFERAVETLLHTGDHERAATALFHLQQAMFVAGAQPTRRVDAARRFIDRITRDAAMLPGVRLWLAGALGYAGEPDAARAELERVREWAGRHGDRVFGLYADIFEAYYVEFWTGSPAASLTRLDRARAELRAIPEGDHLGLMPFATQMSLYVELQAGRYEDALARIEQERRDYRDAGTEQMFGRLLDWTRLTGLGGLRDWEALRREDPALPEGAGTRVSSYGYRLRARLALGAALERDVAAVRDHIAAGRTDMDAFGWSVDRSIFQADFAAAAIEAGMTAEAATLARYAVADAERAGSPWMLARAHMLAAVATGDDPAHVRAALELTRAHDLRELWALRERWIAPGLLAVALAAHPDLAELAGRLLLELGGRGVAAALDTDAGRAGEVRTALTGLLGQCPDADGELVDALLRDRDPSVRGAARHAARRRRDRGRAAVRVTTLGGLRIHRDGREVPTAAFGRQKARTLLGALLAADAPVHRETLREWLWPDLTPERAAGALRVTLHELRRAVEPEVDAGDAGALILSDGERVRVAFGDRDEYDVALLTRLAAPDAALPDLLRAEALCAGPFLPEWPFEDWAAERRRELERVAAEVVDRVADRMLRDGDRPGAIRRYRRLVDLDPLRESWHRQLMTAYSLNGDRALALRQYHVCRGALRREQGVEPHRVTRELYGRLLREEAES